MRRYFRAVLTDGQPIIATAICGGILIVMGTTDFDLANLKPLDTGLIFVLMLQGPSVSGLALTAVLEGRARFRWLWARAANRRVGL